MDHGLFEPFRARGFKLRFLSDYLAPEGDALRLQEGPGTGPLPLPQLNQLNPNLLGFVEQQVAARARVFIGTWWSTFTGYIIRLRGYITPGAASASWYFMHEYMNEMQTYQEPEGAGWWREWPPAWTGIDKKFSS